MLYSMNKQQVASDRTNQINNEIYSRNIPTMELQPNYEFKSTSTRFQIMPIINNNSSPSLKEYNSYSPSANFYGGDRKGPWNTFSNNIDTESDLRNQNYALQNDSLGVYIPSSQSNLYEFNWNNKNKSYSAEETKFYNSDLFVPTKHATFNPNIYSDDVGYALFNNSTRVQNKDIKS